MRIFLKQFVEKIEEIDEETWCWTLQDDYKMKTWIRGELGKFIFFFPVRFQLFGLQCSYAINLWRDYQFGPARSFWIKTAIIWQPIPLLTNFAPSHEANPNLLATKSRRKRKRNFSLHRTAEHEERKNFRNSSLSFSLRWGRTCGKSL